ncbi:MAG: beta-N-acetylhexosaminidase, partial [Nitrospiraceae bacterium]
MTLRDKVGQLFMLGFMGTSVSKDLADVMEAYRPGGMIVFARNLEAADQIAHLTNQLQKFASHSPLLLAIDQEGGRVSRLPAGFTIFPSCGVLGQCGS